MTMPIDVRVRAPAPPSYLGDGLYVDYDGFQFRLYASNGIETLNEVFLEPSVLRKFMDYVKETT